MRFNPTILQKFNVGSFQGYYYAKPLSLDEICVWQAKSGKKDT